MFYFRKNSTPPLFFRVSCHFFFYSFFSFSSEYQLVCNATILLTVQPTAAPAAGRAQESQELLYPARHELTLPLNGLNMLFSDYIVAVNHHTKLDSDRYNTDTITTTSYYYHQGGGEFFLYLYFFSGIFFWILMATVIYLPWNRILIHPSMMSNVEQP